mmetsp:Transcript_33015/g.76064  ORF Transcript_33015/g.76064 Transcript_33015/m.76064 type:complete len:359 (-) Transcript_33015:2759-3835(-)
MFQSAFKYRYPVLHWSRNRQVVNYARTLNTLSLQLDYYMSSQFAGIASAMTNQLYEKNGIDLKFLPICPVGHEMNSVRNNANGEGSSEVSIGSVEQNIFIPMLYKNPNLRVKSVAAMFRKTPLCLTSLKPSSDDQISQNNLEYIVGAHEDTVHLINRILSSGIDGDTKKQVCVKAIPRSKKNTLLTTGEVHAIQTYLTTEVPTLQRIVSSGGIENKVLEGLNGAKLGYSQVLFAPEEDLECNFKREIIQSFLDATFKGWEVAIGDKESAAKSVEEVRAILGLNDENNDHWDSSFSYKVESVGLCNNFVKETFQGDRYGVINPSRWNEATEWLLGEEKNVGKKNIENFGLDATIWQPSH